MGERVVPDRPEELLGRAAELQRAAPLMAELVAGRGHVLVIRGEQGIGKSALLGEIARRAAARGARLALGTAEEAEQRLPFASISACLASARTEPEVMRIADLLHGTNHGVTGAPTTAEIEFLVLEAILSLVDRWCASQPVMLAIDDLQWSDRASLLALHRLGRTAAQLPLLIVAACRSGVSDEHLARLIRSWQARRAELLTLGPIDADAVAQLTWRVTGKRPAPGLLDAVAGAGGNPFYVTEYTKSLLDAGRIEFGRELASLTGGPGAVTPLPTSLIDIVDRCLASLSRPTRDTLPCAAILGPRFSVAELSVTLGVPAFQLLHAVQELLAAGVLVTDADRLAFGHDLIRAAIYESIAPSAREALHLEAAHALARAGAPVERIASHLLSVRTLDAAAIAWTVAASERLSRRAPELAADLFHRALDDSDPADAEAGPLQLGLATALVATHQFGAATGVARQALVHAGTNQASARWILVQALINDGHVDVALDEARAALQRGNPSAVESARFHGIVAQCLHVLSSEGPDAAKAAAGQACEAGLASGDAHAAAYGLQAIAGAERWDGRFVEALRLADHAADYLNGAGPIVDGQLDPHLIRANCLIELDRTNEAAQAYADDLELAEAGIGTFFLAFHHLSVARAYFLRGDWDDALTEIDAAFQVPDHLGLRPHLDGLATLIAVHRGDSEAVARHHRTLRQQLISGSARHTFDDRSWGRCLAALADGDDAEAHDVVTSAWNDCAQGGREFCGHYLMPARAALGLTCGDVDGARRAVEALERYQRDRPGPAMHRSVAFAEAVLAAEPDLLVAVAEEYATAGRPLFEAEARERAAELLAARGDPAGARLQLDIALQHYGRLDAGWDIARATARLRPYGIRPGAHGRRRRPKTGWAALTPTERKVARLVSEGMSNPDIAARTFTSRRTVQFHVANIFTKLDLTSRVELAALVARRPA